MSCDFCVSFICPSDNALYPVSPSLRWVPWASVPHLLGLSILGLRYYVPLRLPFLRLGSLRFRLASRYLACFRFVSCPFRLSDPAGNCMITAWRLIIRFAFNRWRKQGDDGPLKFPGYPCEYMPRSHQIPVVSWRLAIGCQGYCLPSPQQRRLCFSRN